MKKIAWAWIIGSTLFAFVVGVWLWQLPNTLRSAGINRDFSLGSILSSFGETRKALAPEFINIGTQLDENMEKISNSLRAQAAQAAALDKLKKELTNEVAKKKIEAAMTQNPTSPSGFAGQANNQ